MHLIYNPRTVLIDSCNAEPAARFVQDIYQVDNLLALSDGNVTIKDPGPRLLKQLIKMRPNYMLRFIVSPGHAQRASSWRAPK